MYREILIQLDKWRQDPRHKPLLVRGARQVGKTWSVMDFGKTKFQGRVHQFNFEKNPELNRIFDENLDVLRIIPELELAGKNRIVPGEDLLFFDEVQDCPKAIMALRYFYEQKPDLHIVAAGSLIEFALADISFPVGRIQTLEMHPMNFREYLVATGNELLADKLSNRQEPCPETVVQMANRELRKYFIIGGMPEAVMTYLEKGSFLEAIEVQKDLISTFRQDFAKYAGHSDKRCLNQVLSGVAGRVGQQIKYSQLAYDFTQPTIKKAFELMETARLYTRVPSASPSGQPLNKSASGKKFKAVFLDIGLLSAINGFFSGEVPTSDKLNADFRGMMAEQFVGQELRCILGESLFYWSREARGSSAEVDFLIEINGEIIPIEVKSGASGRLASLHLLMDGFPGIRKAIVFISDQYGKLPERRIEFMPLFEAGFLARSPEQAT